MRQRPRNARQWLNVVRRISAIRATSNTVLPRSLRFLVFAGVIAAVPLSQDTPVRSAGLRSRVSLRCKAGPAGRADPGGARTKNAGNTAGVCGIEPARSAIGCTTLRRGSESGWSTAFGKSEIVPEANAGAAEGRGTRAGRVRGNRPGAVNWAGLSGPTQFSGASHRLD